MRLNPSGMAPHNEFYISDYLVGKRLTLEGCADGPVTFLWMRDGTRDQLPLGYAVGNFRFDFVPDGLGKITLAANLVAVRDPFPDYAAAKTDERVFARRVEQSVVHPAVAEMQRMMLRNQLAHEAKLEAIRNEMHSKLAGSGGSDAAPSPVAGEAGDGGDAKPAPAEEPGVAKSATPSGAADDAAGATGDPGES